MEITPLHLKFIAVVGCFPFSVIGLVLALSSWIKHGRRVDWQPVQGTIVFSGVAKSLAGRGASRPITDMTYIQTVEYSYVVNGKEYVNDVFRRGERNRAVLTKEGAREAHLQFKTGFPVTVYVDARDPTNSVLDPNYEEHSSLFTLGLLSATIGGVLWLLATYTSLP